MDTLFFDSGSLGGVLPDTTSFYCILYYQVGDSLYPFLTTIDKDGNVIDNAPIGIGHCRGLLIDIESCVDQVTINRDLSIELFYKVVGSADTNDSIPKTVRICNQILGTGRVTKEGKIEIKKGELEQCE